MKIYLLFFLISIFFHAQADEIKVEVNPPRPVAGELFQVYFRIFTSESELPEISFGSRNLEVVGKSNQGVSTRTVYANGKLTVSRELTVVYDLVASRPGTASLRDISAKLSGKTIKHPELSFEVLKEPMVSPDVFIKADVPKKTLYLGEGMVVRYYLYTKVPVTNMDVKKYPKLNHFLKRFIQDPDRSERVSVDGEIYMRTQIYAAKLFPEKLGEVKIDSLHMSATFSSPRSNDPFGAFGIGQNMRTKTMKSEMVIVEVKPIPSPAPDHFTGLVGPHEFQLEVGQSKLIVNEPLEVKLMVSGVGSLENLEAPVLIKHLGLEEFETNGDLKISDAQRATKIFEYTFLAKENLIIPSKKITLSYFDPETQSFIPKDLNIPEIQVAGGIVPSSPPMDQKSSGIKKSELISNETSKLNLLKELKFDEEVSWREIIHSLNLFLVFLFTSFCIYWFIKARQLRFNFFTNKVPTSFKKGKFELGDFLRWINPLIIETGKTPSRIIQDSSLSKETKVYFINLLQLNADREYSSRKSLMEFKYIDRHFKELGKYIESIGNANH